MTESAAICTCWGSRESISPISTSETSGNEAMASVPIASTRSWLFCRSSVATPIASSAMGAVSRLPCRRLPFPVESGGCPHGRRRIVTAAWTISCVTVGSAVISCGKALMSGAKSSSRCWAPTCLASVVRISRPAAQRRKDASPASLASAAGAVGQRALRRQAHPRVADIAAQETTRRLFHIGRAKLAERERQLITDARVGVVDQLQQSIYDRCRGIGESLRQSHCVLAYARVVVAQARQHHRRGQGVEPVERVERPDPPFWTRRRCAERFQRPDRGAVLALVDEPRGRITMPAVVVVQRVDQLRGLQIAEKAAHRLLEAIGHNAVNSPLRTSAGQIDMFLDDRRQAVGMFNYLARHIQYVQRSVGRVGHLHRAKPDVAGGDELALRSARSPLRPTPSGVSFFRWMMLLPQSATKTSLS